MANYTWNFLKKYSRTGAMDHMTGTVEAVTESKESAAEVTSMMIPLLLSTLFITVFSSLIIC